MMNSFQELWNYRPMLVNLVKREIRGRYKGSVLGFIWNFILPFMQILVYILVFTIVFHQDIQDYYVYLIAGMVPWIFFSDSITNGAGSIENNASLVSKIYFPRTVIPMSLVISKLVNFLISVVIIYAVLLIGGHGIEPITLLFLPIPIFLLFLFSLGLTLALSSLHVYLRDTMYLVNVLVMVWIWLTPLMYVRDNITDGLYNLILDLNPMTYFIDMFHDVFYYKCISDPITIGISVLLAVIAFVFGWALFQHLSKDFAEVL